jgi:hypothetical protein
VYWLILLTWVQNQKAYLTAVGVKGRMNSALIHGARLFQQVKKCKMECAVELMTVESLMRDATWQTQVYREAAASMQLKRLTENKSNRCPIGGAATKPHLQSHFSRKSSQELENILSLIMHRFDSPDKAVNQL